MTKRGTENREQGTESREQGKDEMVAAEVVPVGKAKGKARKANVVAPVEEVALEVSAPVEAAPAKAKAAKKAAKKAAPTKAEDAVPADVALDVPKVETAKKAKKGRDLVVDEPGAAEIADILPAQGEAEPEQAAGEQSFEAKAQFKPEPKLERLQKILAKAGISSRRKAEELILGGRVQINGKVVMELGTKADPAGDHVRVDGKLLQGPERIRYFVLNKPKGFVTTVSDPEGRPTVMQFFAGEHERLYPVGRLDYLSEGLLLVTNDGELANKLTKAASGVEKTYLVKVAGQPTEDMLDVLRKGVVIEKGRPGTFSGRVRTAPAQIRQVRQGDNPWYEVIIIEGRNRELRKMFEEIGHHVEKIRRVGYGPLVLDLEPGKVRELEAEEVHKLRLASEGKLKTKRKGSSAAGQLPTVAGKTVRYKKADGKPGYQPRTRPEARFETGPQAGREFAPVPRRVVRPEFQQESKADFNPAFRADSKPGLQKEFKPGGRSGARPGVGPDARPSSKPAFRSEAKREGRPAFRAEGKPEGMLEGNLEGKPSFKPRFDRAGKADFKPTGRPSFKSAPGAGFKSGGRPAFGSKPRREEPPVTDYVLPPRKAGAAEEEFETKSGHQGAGFNPDYKPGFRTGGKPAFRSDQPGSKPAFRARPAGGSAKPTGSRGGGTQPLGRYNAADDDFVPKKTPGFRVEPVEEKPRSGGFDRGSGGGKPFRPAGAGSGGGGRTFRPRADGPAGARPASARPASARPGAGRSAGSGSRDDARAGSGGSRAVRPDTRPGGRPSSRFGVRSDSGAGSERPARFPSRGAGTSSGASGRPSNSASSGAPAKRFSGAGEDRPREFRPRPANTDGPKKFSAAKPSKPGRPAAGKSGADGEPRKKERWRNSFTGKNKGRPKPKS